MHVAVIAVGVDQRHRRLLGGICAERISRNRVFLPEPDGIRTEAHDPALLKDPSRVAV